MSRLTLFLGLTFALSWASMPLFMLLGGRLDSPVGLFFSMGYMWVPGLCAFVCTLPGGNIRQTLGLVWTPNYWWLVAWLLPPGLALCTLSVSLLMPGVSLSWDLTGFWARIGHNLSSDQLQTLKDIFRQLPLDPFWLAIPQALIAGATLNTLAALGEELGWRGLLQHELEDQTFWRASGIIGGIWGLWHAPLILMGHNYPEHPKLGVLMMLLWCLLLAPLFTWLRLKGHSIWTVALFHGTINASMGLAVLVIKGGNELLVGANGLAGMGVLLVCNLVLFLAVPELSSHRLYELCE